MWIPWFLRLKSVASPVRTAVLAAALGSVATLAATAMALPILLRWYSGDATPTPAVDARFVTLGRDYLPIMGKAYAAAWVDGAKALEAGRPLPDALAAVKQSWEAGRTAAFDHWIGPEFGKLVPDGTADESAKPADKQALARAWRGLARGLDPQSK